MYYWRISEVLAWDRTQTSYNSREHAAACVRERFVDECTDYSARIVRGIGEMEQERVENCELWIRSLLCANQRGEKMGGVVVIVIEGNSSDAYIRKRGGERGVECSLAIAHGCGDKRKGVIFGRVVQ